MADKRTLAALIEENTILKEEIARLHRLEEERRLQLEAAKEVGKVISLRREQFRRNGGRTL